MEILCTTVICAAHHYLKVALIGADPGECESIRDDAGKYPPRQMPALFTRQVCRTETARQAAENLYEYSSLNTVCHSFLGCCAQTIRCFCPSVASGIFYSPSCQAVLSRNVPTSSDGYYILCIDHLYTQDNALVEEIQAG